MGSQWAFVVVVDAMEPSGPRFYRVFPDIQPSLSPASVEAERNDGTVRLHGLRRLLLTGPGLYDACFGARDVGGHTYSSPAFIHYCNMYAALTVAWNSGSIVMALSV
jgi:hypothetical protein